MLSEELYRHSEDPVLWMLLSAALELVHQLGIIGLN